MRIKYEEMKRMLNKILINKGVEGDLADRVSTVITDNTCDGVASHGVNRFSKMLKYIDEGYIKPNERPEVVARFGSLAVEDGRMGLGITNAWYSMERAISIAKANGIGCVALKHTNHWMRGATYGIQAAKQGMIGICFTNTLPNMPAWGAKERCIGNNPLIVAIPNQDSPIVLDMAMSQFSYGKMETLALDDMQLPMVGGFNLDGELTQEPKEILASQRILPTGYWKGSGLSMVLDLLASILSGGFSTKEIGEKPVEYAVSQVFISIDPVKNVENSVVDKKIQDTLEYIKSSETMDERDQVFYPGEQSLKRRKENLKHGIPVNEEIWMNILNY